jgi:hypothetical protein
VELTLSDSASRWKRQRLEKYPNITQYFEYLERRILEYPQTGLSDEFLFANRRTIKCYKMSAVLCLFSGRIVNNTTQLTANYVFNDTLIYVLQYYFSA